MRLVFHPDARIEYRQAAIYYEQQQAGLGLRFVNDIEATLEQIVTDPTRWRILDEDIRRCLASIFPYGVLYTIEGDYILIVAVMHLSRRPSYWKKRMEPD